MPLPEQCWTSGKPETLYKFRKVCQMRIAVLLMYSIMGILFLTSTCFYQRLNRHLIIINDNDRIRFHYRLSVPPFPCRADLPALLCTQKALTEYEARTLFHTINESVYSHSRFRFSFLTGFAPEFPSTVLEKFPLRHPIL